MSSRMPKRRLSALFSKDLIKSLDTSGEGTPDGPPSEERPMSLARFFEWRPRVRVYGCSCVAQRSCWPCRR